MLAIKINKILMKKKLTPLRMLQDIKASGRGRKAHRVINSIMEGG